jgi:glycosidase
MCHLYVQVYQLAVSIIFHRHIFQLKTSIEGYLDKLNKTGKGWPNFCLGNHDHSRAASRFGTKAVDAMNMILLMLQGTPFTYYGEEIGMTDGPGGGGERDAFRTPMQWTGDAPGAGFTDGTPWLPINANYADVNVADMEVLENSHMKIYRQMAELRHSETILFGATEIVANSTVFAMARVKKGNPGFLLVTNLGPNELNIDLTHMKNMAERGTLTLHTRLGEDNLEDTTVLNVGSSVELKSLDVPGHESYLVTFVPNFG